MGNLPDEQTRNGFVTTLAGLPAVNFLLERVRKVGIRETARRAKMNQETLRSWVHNPRKTHFNELMQIAGAVGADVKMAFEPESLHVARRRIRRRRPTLEA